MTPASRKILAALRILTLDSWPATTREVAIQAGKSVSTAHYHLVALREEGLVYSHPRNPQGGWLPA